MQRLPLVVAIATVLLLNACNRNEAQHEQQAATAPATASTVAQAPAAAPPAADAQMQAVLDQLTKLGGKPIETLLPEEARKQPSPASFRKL